MHTLLCVMDYEVTWQIMYVDLNMIWNVIWPALHFDLGLLCRSFIIQVYYAYMFPFMWVIYERLQIVCGQLITDVSGSLIIRFECEQVILILIGLWPPTLWTGSPDYVGLTTQNGDTCLRVNYILLLLVSFGLCYTFFLVMTFIIVSYDLTCLYSTHIVLWFWIMIMFLLFTL